MDFTIHYTMGGVGYGKVISGKDEADARTRFAKELKENYPASLYVITGIESLKEPGVELKQDKTTKEKIDEEEKKHKDNK